ncbi:MAG: ATPase domain-containing protein [Sulfolobales archaeon]|nr:ATPase domain-containing protein [Sulfolobales archaeon]
MSFIFSVGIEGLDRILGYMKTPYLLVIAGHPGAGKTTLASTICYKNALLGRKCLYISFYEDKERLYSYMSHIGIDLYYSTFSRYSLALNLPLPRALQFSSRVAL